MGYHDSSFCTQSYWYFKNNIRLTFPRFTTRKAKIGMLNLNQDFTKLLIEVPRNYIINFITIFIKDFRVISFNFPLLSYQLRYKDIFPILW